MWTLSNWAQQGVSCIILMVCLMFTSLWPLSALYFIWLVMDWQTPERGRRKEVKHNALLEEMELFTAGNHQNKVMNDGKTDFVNCSYKTVTYRCVPMLYYK